jgi:RimJ/RimL family protein N-acetyltransferase
VKVTLAPYDAQYLELLYEWRHDVIAQTYNPIEQLSLDALHDRVAKSGSDFSDFGTKELFFWFITRQNDPVGNISVRNINRMMLTAEIGYGVRAEARGRGYATAAVRFVTHNAFDRTPLRKLIAFVHEGNHASRKVLEAVGYKAEGLLREHYLINGAPANEIIYGALRRDLADQREAYLAV